MIDPLGYHLTRNRFLPGGTTTVSKTRIIGGRQRLVEWEAGGRGLQLQLQVIEWASQT